MTELELWKKKYDLAILNSVIYARKIHMAIDNLDMLPDPTGDLDVIASRLRGLTDLVEFLDMAVEAEIKGE